MRVKQAADGDGEACHAHHRPTPESRGKSLANRQRFLRRAQALVQRGGAEASATRSIKEAASGGEITIPAGGVHEPRSGAPRRAACATRAPRQQGIRRRRPHPAALGWRGRPQASRRRGGRGRLPLRALRRGVPRPLPRRPRAAGSRQAAARRRARATSPGAPAIRAPGSPSDALHRRAPCARASPGASRSGGRASARDRSARERLGELEASGADAEADRGRCATSSSASRAARRIIPYIDPIDLRFRRYEAQPQARSRRR